MADKAVTAPAAPADTTTLTGEDKQWADLARELDGDDKAEDDKPEDKAPEPDKTLADDKAPEPDKPKPTYEQLEAAERGKTAALTEERKARRQAEESLANVNKLIEELRSARKQQQEPPKPEPAKIPDINEDPIAHFKAKVEILERALEDANKGTQQTTQQIQQQREEAIFWDHIRAAETEFRKTSPMVTVEGGQQVTDYDAACEYLKTHRIGELSQLYPDSSAIAQEEARQYGFPTPAALRSAMLQQDAAAIAKRAFQLGVSPAQMYYEAAKARGYKTPTAPANDNKGKATEPIAAAKRGQKAALTISGGEGRKSANDMSLSDLSDLFISDPDAFDREWDRMKAAGKL